MPTVAIRDWLKQQGIPEEQIGWENGQVTVGGKSFYQPTEIREGRSYASPEALQAALNALQGGGAGQTLARTAANITTFGDTQKAPTGTVPIRQYLTARGYNPAEIGWQDNTVVLGSTGYGITPSAVIEGRSYAPRSVVEAALKAAGFRTPAEEKAAARERQIEDLVSQITKTVSQPFSYRPEEDPRFQAARKLQEAEAERASRRALEELNARGIANSTIAIDRLGQIQQQAAENVYSMIPELYQTALSERQQYLSNLASLVNTFNALYKQELERTQQKTPYEEALEKEIKEQQEAAKHAWEREKAYLPYQYATKNALLPWELGPTPAQMLPYQYPTATALVPYTYGPTPYQQSQLAQAAARAAQLSPAERTIDARSQAANMVQAALDELWQKVPGGPPYEAVVDTAKKALNQAKADLTKAGLTKEDIDNSIELLKEYVSTVTGVPSEAFGW